MTVAEAVAFGAAEPKVHYVERRAAYVVIVRHGQVAMVNSGHKCFLPGGGALPDEIPVETVVREVREELARRVRLLRRVGEATQYFYSSTDDRHYRMRAVFFAGEFIDEAASGVGEHRLEWLAVEEAMQACFHECHAWAIRQASSSPEDKACVMWSAEDARLPP